MKHVVIHTDGGCRPNPGIGGWAAILEYKGRRKELAGGEAESTNNRMELTAAIRALEALKEPCRVDLYTDSQYVQKGVTLWMPQWKAKGWKRGKSGEVKNLEMWQTLDRLIQRHDVRWRWVRGHDGNPLNERCDVLCTGEIERLARNS